jgi:release factor glutamine methyltransferase
MFVKGNTLQDLKRYLTEKLSALYSASEIKLMSEVIVCKRLNINRSEYLSNREIRFSESDLLFFRSLVKRLLDHEPFQYVIGETEFYGLVLKTDARALIPRPETEELVDWIVKDTRQFGSGKALRLLDACSGSGCIALALQNALPQAEVHAVEWSEDAYSLLEENSTICELHPVLHRFDVLDAEAFQQFADNSFTLWVSNPPYIPERDKALMAENVLAYEPEMALFVSDDDPLLFYRALAMHAGRKLMPEGWLYFELHEELGEALHRLMADLGFVNIELRKDLQGKNRMLRAQKRNFTA